MAETVQRIETRRPSGYDEDLSAWLWRQAELLGQHRFGELDLVNLIDEVESLAKRDYRKWESAIRLVLLHMLKWDHQPTHRTQSWIGTIVRERSEIEQGLEDSPSYASRVDEAVTSAYRTARKDAAGQTGLPLTTFPSTCPYEWRTILERDFELPNVEP